ncbi:MAG: anaerobic ribonucleoside triphosphate reductase [Oscillospiraceae bacterium]|nr:anaerobic ribonucleoside triphosphate reductase [Oscillospiraceae bacterium]
MITHIIKRDERTVPFNLDKISNAIFRAAQSCGGSDFNEAMETAVQACKVYEKDNKDKIPTVEEIQDIVEKVLIERGHAQTAKSYILYRYNRTRVREMKTNLMGVLKELTFNPAKDSDMKRENANIDGDTAMGTMLKYGSVSAKEFYEMYVLDPRHAKAHINGDIHIHDLDFYTLTTTCTQIDLKKLFKNGFSTGHGFLREPNDISSYSALACIAIQSNQNDQHGGQSIPTFDYAMAEGIKKTYARRYTQNIARAINIICSMDKEFEIAESISKEIAEKYNLKPVLANDNDYGKKEKELLLKYTTEENIDKIQSFAIKNAVKETDRATYQAMEALIHNLNTMNSRAGAQTPFSSINYGTDTSPEGRMVIKNVLLAQEAGLGNGETPIFPIHIFKIKEGINYNPEDPNYDLFKLACRVSAKRLFPNFSFIDAPFNKKYYQEGNPDTEIAYMGCRTRVIGNVHDTSREIVTGRGNLSFTSINLPRLAIKANHNIDAFFRMLDEMMDLTIEQLMHRFEIQCQKKVRNFPFLMGQGIWLDSDKLSSDDAIKEVLKHGTLSVGFIGLAETLKALIGKHHGEDEQARELGLKIVKTMRKRLDEECEKTKLNFSLLATPAEGLSGRFIKIDAKKYGIIEGVTDREYYTNSFHVPVYYNIDAFSKIQIEAPYHELTNAGHISYIELDGDPVDNIDAFEKVVRCMKEAGIGYGSINHPVDRDPICGYTGIIGDTCPKCGRHEDNIHFERIRRITGYLVGTVDRFNDAKRAEVHDRVKHNI